LASINQDAALKKEIANTSQLEMFIPTRTLVKVSWLRSSTSLIRDVFRHPIAS